MVEAKPDNNCLQVETELSKIKDEKDQMETSCRQTNEETRDEVTKLKEEVDHYKLSYQGKVHEKFRCFFK